MTEVLHRQTPGPRRAEVRRGGEVSRGLRPRDLRIHRNPWRVTHLNGLRITDFAALSGSVALAQFIRMNGDSTVSTSNGYTVSYGALGIAIVALWWLVLGWFGARDPRIIGQDAQEFRRVLRATVLFFGWLAIFSLLLKVDMSRAYLAIAFPLGLASLLVSRKLWRSWLFLGRRRGDFVANTLVVGGIRSAQDITMLMHNSNAGYRVSAVWVPDRKGDVNEWLNVPDQFVPVMGTERTLSDAILISEATSVIVTDTEHLGHDGLRELAWELEGVDVELMLSPNVVDVAGSRMTLRDLAGMPFIHVQEPQYAAAGSWPKALFDRIGASLILLAASPILLASAIAVKLSSPGPVFFRQPRGGLNGTTFQMIKFRSMVVDAEARLATLAAERGVADKPLFKLVDDPRITRVGKFLRRFSIDELPQLLNVVRGDMSLVGPRPPLLTEMEMYDDKAHRRMHVKPGMTGLWQVSGRSDIEWEDAVKLDTYYVENWSLTGDLHILWRTVRAVVGSDGAY